LENFNARLPLSSVRNKKPKPVEDVRHRRRFPFAPARRGDAPSVQGRGDLAERLGAVIAIRMAPMPIPSGFFL